MNRLIISLIAIAMLTLSSCVISKKVTYLENMVVDSLYKMQDIPELKIQKYDRLSITISSKTPELAAPFNPDGGIYNVGDNGEITTSGAGGGTTEKGYMVDRNGNIDFPVLGNIPAEGKTVDELKKFIYGRLINENLINSPLVRIELLNLKVMMMGEVGSKGIINVQDGQMSLLEAITRSGGLTNNAVTEEITVIREENGYRKMYVSNIEDVNFFNSPTFYLKQNDIVYVKPRSAVPTPREDLTWRYVGFATGLLTLGVSLVALFNRN
jgi:polysaccharide export outer membrane protein